MGLIWNDTTKRVFKAHSPDYGAGPDFHDPETDRNVKLTHPNPADTTIYILNPEFAGLLLELGAYPDYKWDGVSDIIELTQTEKDSRDVPAAATTKRNELDTWLADEKVKTFATSDGKQLPLDDASILNMVMDVVLQETLIGRAATANVTLPDASGADYTRNWDDMKTELKNLGEARRDKLNSYRTKMVDVATAEEANDKAAIEEVEVPP